MPSSPATEFPTVRRRNKLRLLMLGVMLLLVGIVFTPWIASTTPVVDVLLARAVPAEQGRLSAQSVSLSWSSAISLEGVRVDDASGEPILEIAAVTVERGLWDLLRDSTDLGTVRVTRPLLRLVVDEDGSNLEKFARPWREQTAEPQPTSDDAPASLPTMSLQVEAGRADIVDLANNRAWSVEDFDATCEGLTDPALLNLAASCRIAPAAVGLDGGSARGNASAAGQFRLSTEPAASGQTRLVLVGDELPLALLESAVLGTQPGSKLDGILSIHCEAFVDPDEWTAGTPSEDRPALRCSGSLRIDDLLLEEPSLGSEPIRWARVDLPWQLQGDRQRLVVEELRLATPVGDVAVAGEFDLAQLSGNRSLSTVARQDYRVEGHLHLAALAQTMPQLVRAREGLIIEGGDLQFKVASRPEGNRHVWRGNLASEAWSARARGQRIRWDNPIRIEFRAHEDDQQLRLESLECASDFLKLQAAGDASQLAARAELDLSRLTAELGQFVDIDQLGLAGQGTATLHWQLRDQGDFQADLRAVVDDFRLATADNKVWSEPRVDLVASAAGIVKDNELKYVSSASAQWNSASGVLDASLRSATNMTGQQKSWPLSVRLRGPLSQWQHRASPWLTLTPWTLDGAVDLAAEVDVGTERIAVADSTLTIDNLRAANEGWNFAEPRVEFRGQLRWDAPISTLTVDDMQLTSSTASLRLQATEVAIPADATLPVITGTGAFRADIARLMTLTTPDQTRRATRPPPRWAGMLAGQIEFRNEAQNIHASIDSTAENLQLARYVAANDGRSGQYEVIWQERQARIAGQATYEPARERITLHSLGVQGATAELQARGAVEQLASASQIALSGVVDYDLAEISRLLQPRLGDAVQLQGRERATFEIAGPLVDVRHATPTHWSQRVNVKGDGGWAGAQVAGLRIGPGKIQAELNAGIVTIAPLSVLVGEGRLQVSPVLQLDPEPQIATHPPTMLLDRVRVSPEVADRMLKYMAPILAGATETDGVFSLQLQGAQIPLADPQRADVSGQLLIHGLRVAPGANTRNLVGVVRQAEALLKRKQARSLSESSSKPLLEVDPASVDFRLAQGRVYHRGLEFRIGDVVVRSEGSVGFDESLSVELQLPIQDKWVEREPLLSGLRGQSIQIPVRGTMSRPEIDNRFVADLSTRLLRVTAEQAITDQIQGGLERLFRRRK